jgi:tetratricopeptide (TPR) repeat protein
LDLARRFLDIVALLKDKRWPAALRAVDRAIRRFPAEAGLYALRSFIRNKLGDHALALADAEKAIALNPANANAYLNRAWAMDALRMDPVAVVSSLSKAAELESRFGKYAGPMSPGELSRMMEGAEGLYETEEARPRARQRPAWLFVFAVLAAAAFLLRRRLRSALRRGLG